MYMGLFWRKTKELSFCTKKRFYNFRVDGNFPQPYFSLIYKRPTSIILKSPNPNTKDDDHMNNILEATLQIKDKNIIWDNKVQEKIFKKKIFILFSYIYA